jgi:hypothetical protein
VAGVRCQELHVQAVYTATRLADDGGDEAQLTARADRKRDCQLARLLRKRD